MVSSSCNINVLRVNIVQDHFKHYLKQIYLTHQWGPYIDYHLWSKWQQRK